MMVFIVKAATKLAKMMVSWVSCIVVKILAPVPSQFRVHVMRESCPVALFWNVVTT